ncbi:MAG: hypothetical protein ACFFD4_09490, partial [Candidatus Odinarchaeota archaeon]
AILSFHCRVRIPIGLSKLFRAVSFPFFPDHYIDTERNSSVKSFRFANKKCHKELTIIFETTASMKNVDKQK